MVHAGCQRTDGPVAGHVPFSLCWRPKYGWKHLQILNLRHTLRLALTPLTRARYTPFPIGERLHSLQIAISRFLGLASRRFVMSRTIVSRFCTAVCASLVLAMTGLAQLTTTSIHGIVRDPS